MARPWEGWTVAALVLTLLTTGCIGVVTDISDEGDGTTATVPGAAEPSAQEEAFHALTLAFELDADSRSSVRIQEIQAEGLPGGPSGFVPRPTTLSPGQHAAVAALAVEAGTHVDGFTLHVTLRDGLGPAEVSLQVGPWTAKGDAYQTIRLSMPAIGTVEVRAPEGPVEVDVGTPTAVPTYGYLLWPNGGKRILERFPYVIEVPLDFPSFEAGDQVEFLAHSQGQPVVWRIDGSSPVNGARLGTQLDAGDHVLEVRVGSQAPFELGFSATDHLEFEGQVLAGSRQVTIPMEDVNGKTHPFEIREGNTRTSLYLRPVGNNTFEGDLDLYLADEEGQWVAKSARQQTSFEHLEIHTPMEPGAYTLWIYAWDGARIDYKVEGWISY